MIEIKLGLKEYIKTGETCFLTNDKGEDLGHVTVRVRGFGRYALVDAGSYIIRRDGIKRNDRGDWQYTFHG